MKATAQFIGRIASVKYEVLNNTSTGRETPRLTLQIITTKLIKINERWEERTSSFFVSVWNKLATTLHNKKTIEKGFLVELTTEISTRNTTDQYGNTTYYTDFNLESFTVIQKPQAWFEARKNSSNQGPQDQYSNMPQQGQQDQYSNMPQQGQQGHQGPQDQYSNMPQQGGQQNDYYDPRANAQPVLNDTSIDPIDDDIPF